MYITYIGDHSGKSLLQLCKENGWNTLKHQLSSQQQQQNPIDRLVNPENATEVCYIIANCTLHSLNVLFPCREQTRMCQTLWKV